MENNKIIQAKNRLGLGTILRHQLIMADGETIGFKIRKQYENFDDVEYPMDEGEKKVSFEEFLAINS